MLPQTLHALTNHYCLSHLLFLLGLSLWWWGKQGVVVWKKPLLGGLNVLLLLALWCQFLPSLMLYLFQTMGRIEPENAPFWETNQGLSLLLLYHHIGAVVGILVIWRGLRQSFFFSWLLAVLANYHHLLDVVLASQWQLSGSQIEYELDSFLFIRPEPFILIRTWSLWWLLGCLVVQASLLAGYVFYFYKKEKTHHHA